MPDPTAPCRCGYPQGVYHEDCTPKAVETPDGDVYDAAPPQPVWVRESTVKPGPTGYAGYPQAEAHRWGEFALAAIEFGGYNDATLIDPMTGARLWCPDALKTDSHEEMPTLGDVLRRLADAADHHKFMDAPQG
jgi:hypothetical protein